MHMVCEIRGYPLPSADEIFKTLHVYQRGDFNLKLHQQINYPLF